MESGNVRDVFHVVVRGVVNKVLPGVGGWAERGHKAELARLQVEAEEADHFFLQKQKMLKIESSLYVRRRAIEPRARL